MQPVSHLVRVSLPNYLAGLPIPDSIGGWFRLGVKDWLSLVPFTAAVAGLTYMSYRAFCPAFLAKRPINPNIRKDSKKVVDFIEIEDIAEKASLCRCWLSKKFPYCDGTHNAHNEETGDNVGPAVVKHK
ncbi:CDGSH iron-sulfur domain-containing protein 2 homolog isoform X2 [Bacillus rossius redtenbacheri]|uniref:CDGSH iron-sulfur domain-containing protein 2 homolog isoform X2 n=1 Tax=Bacillus rossius redtenbacheri TaxID=93214 RepID=UPI002FDE8767